MHQEIERTNIRLLEMTRCADEEFINNVKNQIFSKKSIKKKIWTYFHLKSHKKTLKKQEKISDNKIN